jgi:Na+/H+-translocating membrane pyrophosphatase
MENIISGIRGLFENYGGQVALIILATILITNLLKKPILRIGQEIATKKGIDKSVITRFIPLIPLGICFILLFFVKLFNSGFNFGEIEWGLLVAEATSYSAVSIGTYEILKKQFEAYATQKNVKPVETETPEEEKKNEGEIK